VQRRAANRCEYCQTSLRGYRSHLEHIIPGIEDYDNYALACARCNENKREFVTHIDPATGREDRLFHPRLDRWQDHFSSFSNHPVGTTQVGRATADLLFNRKAADVPELVDWKWAWGFRDDTIISFLNDLRVYRLSNQFKQLYQASENLPPEVAKGSEDYRRLFFAIELLKIEGHFMRSMLTEFTDDILQGLRISFRAFRDLAVTKEEKAELLQTRSVLLQQFATVRALENQTDTASQLQQLSARAHASGTDGQGMPRFTAAIRLRALALKHSGARTPLYSRHDLTMAVEDAARSELRTFVYIADLELYGDHQSTLLDRLITDIDELLLRCGYGQDFNYADPIVLRRRWWALKAWAHEPLDIDLLTRDLRFWRRINMHNELRELLFLLRRVANITPSESLAEAIQLIESHLTTSTRM
jgi:hypothetical protein